MVNIKINFVRVSEDFENCYEEYEHHVDKDLKD